jgi:hypothetical protein
MQQFVKHLQLLNEEQRELVTSLIEAGEVVHWGAEMPPLFMRIVRPHYSISNCNVVSQARARA